MTTMALGYSEGRVARSKFRSECSKAATRQSGQTILLMVLMLALGGAFAFFALASPTTGAAERMRRTAQAMGQVKQALIGWSAARAPSFDSSGNLLPNARPGELPCPDINPLDGYEDGSCAAGALGKVPWKTLRIPEPLDGEGETLWYAVSTKFRVFNLSSDPIMSDTQGDLTVYQGSTAMTLTTRSIAVIIAPGRPLGLQVRGTTSAACAATGTTVAQNQCPGNYLDSIGGESNADVDRQFILASPAATFNDQMLYLTNADLMPGVEQRVAYEMMSLLNQYKIASGVYPWADIRNGESNDGTNRPRFPCYATPTNWGSGGTPALPNWLLNGCPAYPPDSGDQVEGWAKIIYYSAARDVLASSCDTCESSPSQLYLDITNSGFGHRCTAGSIPLSCTSTQITSTDDADVIVITPGAWNGVSSHNWPNSGAITGYFSDAENSDNNDDDYVIPSSAGGLNRDRLYVLF